LPQLDVGRFGTLNVAGTLTSAGRINLNGGTLAGTGTVRGNVRNAGVVRPGNSPGILTIDGDYTQTAAGILEIDLAGAIAGSQYDQLKITGKAVLAGAVNFVLVDGFVPHFGNNFQVLSAPVTTGNLTSTNAQFAVGSDGSLSAHVPITASTPGKVRGSGAVGSRSRIFSFDVRATNKNGKLQFSGSLQFQDRARRIKLQSTAITALQKQPGGQVLLQGIARVNGKSGYHFTVRFDNNARQRDPHARFRIVIVGPGNFLYDSAS